MVAKSNQTEEGNNSVLAQLLHSSLAEVMPANTALPPFITLQTYSCHWQRFLSLLFLLGWMAASEGPLLFLFVLLYLADILPSHSSSSFPTFS